VESSFHLDGDHGIIYILVPCLIESFIEDAFVSLHHFGGFLPLVVSDGKDVVDLVLVDSEIKDDFMDSSIL
jgi:hypothetical protein